MLKARSKVRTVTLVYLDKLIKIPHACGYAPLPERTRDAQTSPPVGGHLFENSRNLAYLVFCLSFAKNKCAKLGIANTGFSNPQKAEENKKLKTVSISLNYFYETLF